MEVLRSGPRTPERSACGERKRLIELYAFRCRKYYEAVALLGECHDGIGSFRHAFTESKMRRVECEQIRTELNEHIARHGCLDPMVALDENKTIRGFIAICAWCKKIRGVKGSWQPLEGYLLTHTMAKLSHTICPECVENSFPEMGTQTV